MLCYFIVIKYILYREQTVSAVFKLLYYVFYSLFIGNECYIQVDVCTFSSIYIQNIFYYLIIYTFQIHFKNTYLYHLKWYFSSQDILKVFFFFLKEKVLILIVYKYIMQGIIISSYYMLYSDYKLVGNSIFVYENIM